MACDYIETACDDFPCVFVVVNSVNKENNTCTTTQITSTPLARRTSHSGPDMAQSTRKAIYMYLQCLCEISRQLAYPLLKYCFLPARRYASAGNSDRNVSVCLSVRSSVTSRYCVKTKKVSVMISPLPGSPKTLVFCRQISSPNSKGFP